MYESMRASDEDHRRPIRRLVVVGFKYLMCDIIERLIIVPLHMSFLRDLEILVRLSYVDFEIENQKCCPDTVGAFHINDCMVDHA
jgi:ABC-type enterochelin transport system permease subunit